MLASAREGALLAGRSRPLDGRETRSKRKPVLVGVLVQPDAGPDGLASRHMSLLLFLRANSLRAASLLSRICLVEGLLAITGKNAGTIKRHITSQPYPVIQDFSGVGPSCLILPWFIGYVAWCQMGNPHRRKLKRVLGKKEGKKRDRVPM
jgi:hypothetical protein